MLCFLSQVKALAGEVVAHLRSVAGAEALLAAYNEARRGVAEARVERRRQRTLQARAPAMCCGLRHCAGESRRGCGVALHAGMRHGICALLHGCTSLHCPQSHVPLEPCNVKQWSAGAHQASTVGAATLAHACLVCGRGWQTPKRQQRGACASSTVGRKWQL